MNTTTRPEDPLADIKARVAALEQAGRFGYELMLAKSELQAAVSRPPAPNADEVAMTRARIDDLKDRIAGLEKGSAFASTAPLKTELMRLATSLSFTDL